MVVAFVLVAVVVAAGVCAVFGWCADSRDPEYSLGKMLAWRPHDNPIDARPGDGAR